MLRKKKFYVIYPEYFDKDISRKQGRRISVKKASEEMSLDKLNFACKKLELDFKIEADKAFPNKWWEQNGRVLISIDKKNKIPKQSIINDLALITRKLKVKIDEKTKNKSKNTKYSKKSTHSKKKSSYQTQKKKKLKKREKDE